MKLIQLDWDGPYSLSELNNLADETDYGVYQIYGKHNVYGDDVLLYIGMADLEKISKRVSQANLWNTFDAHERTVYIGRLAGPGTPSEEQWSSEIALAEQLLIYVHKPAFNSKSLNAIDNAALQHVHLLNWGIHRDLLPEVSGLRWTSVLNDEEYELYEWK